VTRAVLVPRSEVTVHDTWHTTGLRGTASNDFSIEGVFVPASRGFQVLVDPPLHESPLFRALMLIFVNHGSHALGVGRAGVDAAKELVSTKRGWGDVPLSEVPRVQAVIAEATALVESARAYLYATLEELWAAVQAGGEGTPLQRARVRLAASHAASASVRAVDLVHGLLATSAIFTTSSLERQFRDVHTAAAHVMIGMLTYEAAGRVELGLAPEFPFF
jgi:alkylation response protein AidB-like acyl-CoA dehydrogenase